MAEKKYSNYITVKGLLAESNLEIKMTKTGKRYIGGNLVIRTGENSLHKLKVNTYELKKDGTVNKMYTGLVTAMNEHKSEANFGEEADAVECKVSLELDDYKGRDGQMTSYLNKVASSVARIDKATLATEAKGTCHVFVGAKRMEVSADGDETGRAIVDGYMRTYRGELFPVEFKIENPKGVDVLMGGDYERGTLIECRVELVNSTEKVKRVKEYEFGEPEVLIFDKIKNEIVITGLKRPDPTLEYTIEDFNKAIVERELMIETKKNEVKGTGSTPAPTASKAPVATDDFDF